MKEERREREMASDIEKGTRRTEGNLSSPSVPMTLCWIYMSLFFLAASLRTDTVLERRDDARRIHEFLFTSSIHLEKSIHAHFTWTNMKTDSRNIKKNISHPEINRYLEFTIKNIYLCKLYLTYSDPSVALVNYIYS